MLQVPVRVWRPAVQDLVESLDTERQSAMLMMCFHTLQDCVEHFW